MAGIAQRSFGGIFVSESLFLNGYLSCWIITGKQAYVSRVSNPSNQRVLFTRMRESNRAVHYDEVLTKLNRNMKYDTFEDANRPNGTRARGFRLISEWDIKRLVWVVVCAVVLDICVVAVTAVVARQFQTALAVGSYALGLEALLLTMCTLLSAVL